jgi:uncharacterized protein (DUF2235 family)
VKNIVICFDGTGNQIRANDSTSVVRLYSMLDLADSEQQIGYYDPGVGTMGSSRSWTPWGQAVTKVLGLGFGLGLRENLGEAYTFLMGQYEEGDRIYVFGFSRGAYTARALCGMLLKLGLLRNGSQNLVPYAVNLFTSRDPDWARLGQFGSSLSRRDAEGRMRLRVHYLGIWDTVKAAGLLRGGLKWPDTRQLPNVSKIRHAVSIDEKRRPFQEYLVWPVKNPARNAPARELDEVWFAGVHSDVGGTFEDHELADIALKWMAEDAMAWGLRLRKDVYEDQLRVTPEYAHGRVHSMGRGWALLGYRRRTVPEGARIHASVQRRIAVDAAYGQKLPSVYEWDDVHWADGIQA